MSTKQLEELLSEVEAALKSGSIRDADRPLLEHVRADLTTALGPGRPAAPHGLRDNLRAAVSRFETEHPGLTSLISKTLDTLRDLGV